MWCVLALALSGAAAAPSLPCKPHLDMCRSVQQEGEKRKGGQRAFPSPLPGLDREDGAQLSSNVRAGPSPPSLLASELIQQEQSQSNLFASPPHC